MDDNFALVEFQDHKIVSMFDGHTIWVAVRQVCAAIGLHWPAQRRKIQHDIVLADSLAILTSPMKGYKRVISMPLEFLQGWLFSISVKKPYEESVRLAIVAWRRDAYHTFYDYWISSGRIVDPIVSPQRFRDANLRRLELSSLLDRLERESHPDKRRIIHAVVQRACAAEGIAPPLIDAIAPPPSENCNRGEAFFQLLADLRAKGVVIDYHRDPELLAVQVREVEIAAAQHLSEHVSVPQLRPALRAHAAFKSARVVNCRDGKSRFCWIFWRDKLPVKIPPLARIARS